ncbi:putative major facilitator superfamily transporter [Caenibius tardaugens NBRC 16725]|uniref:Putative major facilitator superfamily transporter n=1 Tax=Caenibius tardaugens NBRC 16725 TaxID=1219035 RepID=U3A6R5_9SPHN|nr:MFS transporter [Caenibius tardaugens]AZI35469.1 MFS transporter [Caenibius tardaugens NBRC 16725]GAD50433.1 putative major facilitator superfamily transporter [Caenibius tardaugens NBRC 16725]
MTTTPASAAEQPLASPMFRALWIATIVSNVGTWMHDVGAGWLMTSLSPDPLMVALVQAATTFPMFALALPAGALADIIDRRRLLIGAQLFGLVGAAGLAGITLAGFTTAWILLVFTALIAVGAAFSAPAFQAIVPELVPTKALQQAVALNSLGVNIARAIGPALGGVIIAASGPAAVFAVNALSVIGVIIVLVRWRRTIPERSLPAEHMIGAMRAGLRYAMRAPELQIVLVRSVGFFLFASGLWALLPIIARRDLGLGPAGYGGLLTFMGLGAIAGAMLMPRLRGRISVNMIALAASVMLAGAMATLATVTNFWSASAALFGAGLAWIAMMATLNGGAQATSPGWVKARALAIYLLIFQGSMAGGSALWGTVASRIGVPSTLGIAAGLLAAVALILAWRAPFDRTSTLDLAPSAHWPAPLVDGGVEHDSGPVLVTIEYTIAPEKVADFFDAMQDMQRIRRRDGAIHWGVYEDTAHPGTVIETFTVESWLEHLRQHDRVTNADRVYQDALAEFHIKETPPKVRHFVTRS